MKLNQQVFFILILIVTSSCKQTNTKKHDKIRRVVTEDVIAEGEISIDTIFNGLIKFYDTASKKMVIAATYKNGILNGERKDYYLNGTLKNVGYFENGKQLGTVSYHDSSGQLRSKQDFYYDLEVGSGIEYKNNKVSKYYFTSFDNQTLFYIDYDSIFNKEIKEINKNNFFFFHSRDVEAISTNDKHLEQKEFFIYIINPPDFNFEYSLCVINNKDSILRVEKIFTAKKVWDRFTLDSKRLNKDERFTLRLAFDRGLNDRQGEKGDMLKRL
jgi:hypothetical protein